MKHLLTTSKGIYIDFKKMRKRSTADSVAVVMTSSALTNSIHRLLVVVVVVLGVCSLCCGHPCVSDLHTDGCSIPFNSSFPYRRIFRPACIRHDVCYFCGSMHKWSREECDKGFLHDMLVQCEIATNQKRSHIEGRLYFREKNTRENTKNSASVHPSVKRFSNACRWTAYLYYWSVYNFAQSHFEETSPKWCKWPCSLAQGIPNLDKYNNVEK